MPPNISPIISIYLIHIIQIHSDIISLLLWTPPRTIISPLITALPKSPLLNPSGSPEPLFLFCAGAIIIFFASLISAFEIVTTSSNSCLCIFSKNSINSYYSFSNISRISSVCNCNCFSVSFYDYNISSSDIQILSLFQNQFLQFLCMHHPAMLPQLLAGLIFWSYFYLFPFSCFISAKFNDSFPISSKHNLTMSFIIFSCSLINETISFGIETA